jgi:hypothetical protein
VPSDEQDGKICIETAYCSQQFQPIHAGHVDVANHGGKAAPFDFRKCLRAMGAGGDVERILQGSRNNIEDHSFVIDDQNRWRSTGMAKSGMAISGMAISEVVLAVFACVHHASSFHAKQHRSQVSSLGIVTQEPPLG